MGILSRMTKKKASTKRKPKTLKDILNDAYLRSLKKDPELLKEIAFRDAGHADVLDRDREVEDTKKQIKKHITNQALQRIQQDPELAEQFIEGQMDEIMNNGKPSTRSRRSKEPEYLESGMGYGSSIEQALSEIDSLAELKTKLSELGLSGGGEEEKGFFKGITMKDILTVLPYITGRGGDSNGPTQQQSDYRIVVEIDGEPTSVTKEQYDKMLKQGTVKPVARLATKETKEPEKPTQEEEKKTENSDDEYAGIQTIGSSSPEPETDKKETADMLNEIDVKGLMQEIDMDQFIAYFDLEPSNFVDLLENGVKQGDEASNFLWGFLTNVNYDGVVDLLGNYKDEPKVEKLLEKIRTDEGKEWLENVISLIKEKQSQED